MELPENADGSHQDQPVPEEDVDRLIVEVNGQYTLYGVRMYVDHVLTTDLEVAQSDPWKRHITLLGPVPVGYQVADDLEAKGTVLGGQDDVEKEQLADHVADVDDLRYEEQNYQVVANSVNRIN